MKKLNFILLSCLFLTACNNTSVERNTLKVEYPKCDISKATKCYHEQIRIPFIHEEDILNGSKYSNIDQYSEYISTDSERTIMSNEFRSEKSLEEIRSNEECAEIRENELNNEKITTEEECQEILENTNYEETEIREEANSNVITEDAEDLGDSSEPYYGADNGDAFTDAECDRSDLTYVGEWTVTFYCQCEQCCGKWAWSNSTASGVVPQAGWTVAAGPSYPFGTILKIEGFGTYEVQDRGVPDGWVDIYVNDHSEIPSYGMTTASVYIVR